MVAWANGMRTGDSGCGVRASARFWAKARTYGRIYHGLNYASPASCAGRVGVKTALPPSWARVGTAKWRPCKCRAMPPTKRLRVRLLLRRLRRQAENRIATHFFLAKNPASCAAGFLAELAGLHRRSCALIEKCPTAVGAIGPVMFQRATRGRKPRDGVGIGDSFTEGTTLQVGVRTEMVMPPQARRWWPNCWRGSIPLRNLHLMVHRSSFAA
jgi:hypothetical protein